MSSEAITLVVEFSIKAGQAEAFEAASRAMRTTVERDEPGTLRYDWFVSEDRSRGLNIEVFRDSDALAQHMANTADLAADLLAAADLARLDVLGDLTAAGHAAIDAAATGHLSLLGGIAR